MPTGDQQTHVKTARPGDDLPGEAAGLRWLGEPQTSGGVRVAEVISVSPRRLEIARITPGRPSADAAQRFGRALARTHAAGAPWWGCPPPGWTGELHMGRSKTPLVDHTHAPATWGEFYAEHRIAVFARDLRDAGRIGTADLRMLDELAKHLRAGDLDSEQPGLVRRAGHTVARVHGDMWSGNVLWDGSPDSASADARTGAALIDPMAHGGHAETDLATLTVFGFEHLDHIYASYDEVSPLAPGWRDRIELHQLGIVIMHAHLFGGGYVDESLRLARRYV